MNDEYKSYYDQADDAVPEGEFYFCLKCGEDLQFVILEESDKWKWPLILAKISCVNCGSTDMKSQGIKIKNQNGEFPPDLLIIKYAAGQDDVDD